MPIKVIKTKDGKSKLLEDIKFDNFDEAIEYVEKNIIAKDTNKYFSYRYTMPKPNKADVKEFVFIDDNEYFMYSYKIAKIS